MNDNKEALSPNGATQVMGNGKSPAKLRKKKQFRRKIIIGIVAVIFLAAAAFFLKAHFSGADDALKDLQTAQAFRTTLVETVSATGTVTAQTGAQVKIGSQVTGQIKRLYADVGSHVTANQIIAQLNLPDVQAQRDQAEAALSQAITKLQQQQSGVGMERTQALDAVKTSLDNLRASAAKRTEAVDTATMQPQQTASDIAHAAAALDAARAAEIQTEKSDAVQLTTAQDAIAQAKANAKNTAAAQAMDEKLFHEGDIAAVTLNADEAQANVSKAQLDQAVKSLPLTQAKVAADMQSAQQQVVEAQAALQAARAETYQNAIKNVDVGNANAAVQQAQAALNSSQAGLAADTLKDQDVLQAREAVRQAAEQVKYQQAQVDKTYIRSPISGTVTQMASQQGETLAAGLSAPTLIVVTDLSKLQVDAFVDETDIGKVKIGQSVTVTVDAFPDHKFTGKVFKVASGSTLEQNVVTYDVSVAIHDPDRMLKPDMTASVIIAVGEHPDVVAVPNEAIKPGTSGSNVWVVTPGEKEPQMQPVKTGATDGTYTEIVSGVNEGDTVVLAGWPPPRSGSMTMTPFGVRPGGGGGGGGGGRRGG